MSTTPSEVRDAARRVAAATLAKIETKGAFANLALPAALDASKLDARDRALVTELVYGTTRMRRACDWIVDRFLHGPVEPTVRSVLRLGAYQLTYLRIPPHAAVSATVDVAPRKARGLVNAVLRKVADHPVDPDAAAEAGGWPDLATRLSYPDWIVERLTDELGADRALAALQAMNAPAQVHERADGYVQDLASQAVVDQVAAQPGERIVDLCAAPGGKATALGAAGAQVVAADRSTKRAGLIGQNLARLSLHDQVQVVIADGRATPIAPGWADAVLIDAPCSGLGSLRRRADARWRIGPDDVTRLATLQHDLLVAGASLLGRGGRLIYSVCTVLAAETVAVAEAFSRGHPEATPLAVGAPFEPFASGGLLLPTPEGSDGMACFAWRIPSP